MSRYQVYRVKPVGGEDVQVLGYVSGHKDPDMAARDAIDRLKTEVGKYDHAVSFDVWDKQLAGRELRFGEVVSIVNPAFRRCADCGWPSTGTGACAASCGA